MKHMRKVMVMALAAMILAAGFAVTAVYADSTYHSLAGGTFSQNWSNTGMITVNDDWSGVPSIMGYRGDSLTVSSDVDPQTVLAEGTGVVDVNANQTNPAIFNTGGIAEFELADPVIALKGSGTADAPFLLIYLDTTGVSDIQISYNVRDIDASANNEVSQLALQYRVGETGNFVNIPEGYVADATTGPSLATLVTPISVTLPAAAENQPKVQIRIITTNTDIIDEHIGIDDIQIGGEPLSAPPAAPTNLTATAASGTQINLSWTDNSSDETGFEIYRSTVLIHTTGENETSYSDTGLSCEISYDYVVKAVNAGGESGPANASATTGACAAAESEAEILFLQVQTTPVEVGAAVRLTAYVQNTGTTDLSAVQVRYYMDGPGGFTDAWVGPVTIASLAPDRYYWSHYFWTVPANAPVGDYTFTAQVFDAGGSAVSEMSASATFSVINPMTGYTAQVIRVWPVASVTSGTRVLLKAYVKNTDTAPLAAGSAVHFLLNGSSVGTANAAGLAAGTAKWFYIYNTPAAGTYTFTSQVKNGGTAMSPVSTDSVTFTVSSLI